MKKTISIVLIIIFIILVIVAIWYFANRNDSAETSINTTQTAESIVNELKAKISYIGNVVAYTEETDLNNLLGRPNQYTSKVTFEDIRLEQINLNNEYLTEEERKEPTGGTIEVFNNEEDMLKRKEYIESVTSNISALSEYIYSKGNVLLRLEHDLTPTQAKEYEEAFYEIIK